MWATGDSLHALVGEGWGGGLWVWQPPPLSPPTGGGGVCYAGSLRRLTAEEDEAEAPALLVEHFIKSAVWVSPTLRLLGSVL